MISPFQGSGGSRWALEPRASLRSALGYLLPPLRGFRISRHAIGIHRQAAPEPSHRTIELMGIAATDFRHLSISERIQLVEDLWDSIAAEAPGSIELSQRQREEIRRRIAEHDANPSSAVPWDVVRAELIPRGR